MCLRTVRHSPCSEKIRQTGNSNDLCQISCLLLPCSLSQQLLQVVLTPRVRQGVFVWICSDGLWWHWKLLESVLWCMRRYTTRTSAGSASICWIWGKVTANLQLLRPYKHSIPLECEESSVARSLNLDRARHSSAEALHGAQLFLMFVPFSFLLFAHRASGRPGGSMGQPELLISSSDQLDPKTLKEERRWGRRPHFVSPTQ